MIFCSSGSRWISETIETLTSSSMASSRCWRSTFSNRRAFSSAADACSDRRFEQALVLASKSPPCLFSAWVMPITSWFLLRIGTQRMLRVR
jgi:hypothetical protein